MLASRPKGSRFDPASRSTYLDKFIATKRFPQTDTQIDTQTDRQIELDVYIFIIIIIITIVNK